MIPTFVYVPMNFLANWFFANCKINYIMYMAAMLQLVGGWIRIISFMDNSFWPLMLGSFIVCCSTAFCFNAMSLVANMWFPESERGKSTAWSSMMIIMGTIFGFTLTAFISAGMDRNNPDECINRLKKIVYI